MATAKVEIGAVATDLLDPTYVDLLTRESGFGTYRQTVIELLAGLNNRGFGGMVPHNTDNQGLMLFTRPRLNLSYDNLAASRVLTPMMVEDSISYGAYIRDLLDPHGAIVYRKKNCPLLDLGQPFMPILTNTLINASGWPDLQMGTFTSDAGDYQEEYSFADGTYKLYHTWEMTCNFRNIDGDPITTLFHFLHEYEGLVHDGSIFPHTDAIVEQEIDYNIAIWRLVLNFDRTRVQKIARTIAFPTTVPMGAAFNYDNSLTKVTENDQISVQFKCQGAEYNDPILLYEFNRLVTDFNSDMVDGKRTSTHTKLSKEELGYFNFVGYPRINVENHNELEWWVPNAVYAALTKVRKYGK